MDSNRAFGAFLRSSRARLDPAAFGAAERPRRRTPGLRREEVAQRAGISSEWYVKLEQGRVAAPPAGTVEALGRALLLDPVALDHLRRLARAHRREPFLRETVPDTLRQIVARLPEPAYVTGQRLDVLAWNDAASDLFGDFARLAPDDRNILLWMFDAPAARALFGSTWPAEAQRMLALFRAAYDLWPGDPAFAALVDRLGSCSTAFAPWWAQHGIAVPVAGTKRLLHPRLGPVRYDYASFQANDDPALKLALYMGR